MSYRCDPPDFVAHCRELARTRGQELAYTWLRDGEVEQASLTFAELDAEARKVAAQLAARGLAGERALLMYSPGLEFIAAFLGCFYAGVVAVPPRARRVRGEQDRGRCHALAGGQQDQAKGHQEGRIGASHTWILGCGGRRCKTLSGWKVYKGLCL